jgi:tRNA-specific 2-thiouridylase
VRLREVNWLGDEPLPLAATPVEVKLRSTMPPVSATLALDCDGGGEVCLDQPQAAVAPGQACVFYRGDRVLGGGFITRDDGHRPPPSGQ